VILIVVGVILLVVNRGGDSSDFFRDRSSGHGTWPG
jgi:hypothetical protein